MFESEAILVKRALPDVVNFFKNEYSDTKVVEEPKGLFGIPDVLLFNGEIIAFEFKLSNWKQAIKQAFRYTSFSANSYVIMDEYYINRALRNVDQFEKYNIGLASYGKDGFNVYFQPRKRKPFSEQLFIKAKEIFV